MYKTNFILLRKHITAATRKIASSGKVSSQSCSSIRKLQRKLRRLQQINKSASSLINERRRLIALLRHEESIKAHKIKNHNCQSEDHFAFLDHDRESAKKENAEFTSTKSSFASSAMLQHLPQNSALNSAMAFMLHQHRDKRAELEFTRHLITSTLLSLATPVGAWDPYDVKSQVFALDTFIVLPVFTSLEFVELFCAQFGFTVRDPSGVLWVDGQHTHEEWSNNNSKNSTKERIHALLEANLITCEESWEQNAEVMHKKHLEKHDEIKLELETKELETMEFVRPTVDNENTINDSKTQITMDTNASPVPQSTQTLYAVNDAKGSAEQFCQEPLCEQYKTEITPSMLFDIVDPEVSSREALQTQHTGKASTIMEEEPNTVEKLEQCKKSKRKWKKKSKRHHKRMNKNIGENKHNKGTFTKEHIKLKSSSSSSSPSEKKAGEEEKAKMKSKRRKETVHQMLEHLASIQPFHIKQAQPLPMFGTPIRPYFVGYFADIDTLLQNATIVPTKVDIIVNPCSPLEFVLAREATNKIKNKDELLSLAYRNLEKELQREFAAFFMAYCPEIKSAKSACIPLPLSYAQVKQMEKQASDAENVFDHSGKDDSNSYEYTSNDDDDENAGTSPSSYSNFPNSSMSSSEEGSSVTRGTSALERRSQMFRLQRELQFSNWMNYELVIIVDSSDYASTFHKLQIAKHKGVIVGHSELDVLPVELAAPHVEHAATLFYDGNKSICNTNHGNESKSIDLSANTDCSSNNIEEGSVKQKCCNAWGKFRQIGDSVTINTKVPSDSFYQDPTNVYTEPHAVFTEYLKLHRGQQ